MCIYTYKFYLKNPFHYLGVLFCKTRFLSSFLKFFMILWFYDCLINLQGKKYIGCFPKLSKWTAWRALRCMCWWLMGILQKWRSIHTEIYLFTIKPHCDGFIWVILKSSPHLHFIFTVFLNSRNAVTTHACRLESASFNNINSTGSNGV